jgi:hypothetical protein
MHVPYFSHKWHAHTSISGPQMPLFLHASQFWCHNDDCPPIFLVLRTHPCMTNGSAIITLSLPSFWLDHFMGRHKWLAFYRGVKGSNHLLKVSFHETQRHVKDPWQNWSVLFILPWLSPKSTSFSLSLSLSLSLFNLPLVIQATHHKLHGCAHDLWLGNLYKGDGCQYEWASRGMSWLGLLASAA